MATFQQSPVRRSERGVGEGGRAVLTLEPQQALAQPEREPHQLCLSAGPPASVSRPSFPSCPSRLSHRFMLMPPRDGLFFQRHILAKLAVN